MCLQLHRKNKFNAAQVYVGISRAASLRKIHLMQLKFMLDFAEQQLSVIHPSALAEYDVLRKESVIF